jgi:hypothetical protein
MVRAGGFLRRSSSTKRIILATAISSIILVSVLLSQLNTVSTRQSAPAHSPVGIQGNPDWDMVGAMILYRNNSEAGNHSYWVAQSFQIIKPLPTTIVRGLIIYVWLARDVPPSQSFQGTVDNITVLLVAIVNGTPDIDNPIANQTIGPQNISAEGPYPRGIMDTNSSFAVRLTFLASNPLIGFAEGNYAIFMYRTDLGDNDDYHIGYAYYWAASKLDLYYGGGSWQLDANGTWSYYPIDMCFALAEIT